MPIVKKLIEQFYYASSKQIKFEALNKLSQFTENEDALNFLIDLTSHEDEEVRRIVIKGLANFKDNKAKNVIIKALEDPNWDIRQEVLLLVGQKGNDEAIEPLTKLLSSDDWDVRKNVIKALGKIGNIKGFNHIVENLKDTNEYVRKACIEALIDLGAKESIPYIRDALKDPSPYVRATAAKAIGIFKDIDSIDNLMILLSPKEPEIVKKNVLETLNTLSIVSCNELNSDNITTKQKAIEVLGKIGTDKTKITLINLLNNSDILIRRKIVDAFIYNPDKSYIPHLEKIINNNDEDTLLKVKALKVISKIKDNKSVELIIKSLSSDNELIKETALECIEELNDPNLIQHILPLCNDSSSNIRFLTVKLISKFKSPQAIDKLLSLSYDKEEHIRKQAKVALHSIEEEQIKALNNTTDLKQKKEILKTLAKISYPNSLEYLLTGLEIEDIELQNTLIKAINTIDYDGRDLSNVLQSNNETVLFNTLKVIKKKFSSKNITILLDLLNKENDKLKKEVESIIFSYKDKAIDTLIFSLTDNNLSRKINALRILSNYNDVNVVSSIITTALQDRSLQVKKEAIIALGKIASPLAIEALQNLLQTVSELKDVINDALNNIYKEQKNILIKSKDIKNKIEAIEAINKFKDKNIVLETLLPLLNDKETIVQKHVIKILSNYKDIQIINKLLPKLESQDNEIVEIVKDILINQIDISLQPLLDYLQTTNNPITAQTIGSILNQTNNINLLIDMMTNEQIDKKNLMYALSGEENNQRVYEFLIDNLNQPDIKVSYAAVSVLKDFNNPDMVKPLLKKLQDISNVSSQDLNKLKLEIIKILTRYQDISFLPVLKQVLINIDLKDKELVNITLEAISHFDNEDVISILMDFLSQNSEYKDKIKNLLLPLININNIKTFINYLNSSNKNIVEVAFYCLLSLKDKNDDIEDILLEYLNINANSIFLKNIIDLLGELKIKKAALPLLLLLDQVTDNYLKYSIINSLGKIKEPSVVNTLLNILETEENDTKLKIEIVKALGKIADRNALGTLVTLLLTQHDFRLSKYVIEALGYIPEEQTISYLKTFANNDDNSLQAWILRNEAKDSIQKINLFLNERKQIKDISTSKTYEKW